MVIFTSQATLTRRERAHFYNRWIGVWVDPTAGLVKRLWQIKRREYSFLHSVYWKCLYTCYDSVLILA